MSQALRVSLKKPRRPAAGCCSRCKSAVRRGRITL